MNSPLAVRYDADARCDYTRAAEVTAFITARAPHVTSLGQHVCIAVVRGDSPTAPLIAGLAFNEYRSGRDIQIHMAAKSPRWATRRIWGEILRYPFIQLGCARLTACTGSRNTRCARMLEGIGFRLEGQLREFYPDEDLLIYGLLAKDAAKWIRHFKGPQHG